VERVQFRSGWVTFAAVILGIVGVWNVLSGIAAISKDDQTERLNEVMYGINITAWGWFWLILGALQILTSWLIYQRNSAGQMLGLLWAFISASLAVFMIFVAPLWAIAVLAIDIAVIYALLTYGEEFEQA
jgi:hypothetical protein